MCFNEYVDGVYVGVAFLLLIPIFVAVVLDCQYRGRHTSKMQRNNFTIACVLSLITITLLYIWTVYYFSKMYQYPDYHQGFGDKDDKENYHKRSKTMYIVEQCIIGVTLIALYIY